MSQQEALAVPGVSERSRKELVARAATAELFVRRFVELANRKAGLERDLAQTEKEIAKLAEDAGRARDFT